MSPREHDLPAFLDADEWLLPEARLVVVVGFSVAFVT